MVGLKQFPKKGVAVDPVIVREIKFADKLFPQSVILQDISDDEGYKRFTKIIDKCETDLDYWVAFDLAP